MKFGLSFLPDCSPKDKSGADYFKEALSLCDLADEAGFHYVKMTEHYLHPYGGYCPSPLSFLCAVAARTSQIRLMTGCVLPVFHHPIQLAADTAMLDAISNGRAEIGFARAYLPHEFEAFNISLDESRDRYTETIEAVKRLWLENNVTINNQFFSFSNANSLPKVVQKPHPPIWGAAVNSRQTFAWLGEKQINLLITPAPGPLTMLTDSIELYKECYNNSRNLDSIEHNIAISLPICLDADRGKAKKNSNIYLQQYINVWADAADSWKQTKSSNYPGYEKIPEILRNNTPENMRMHTQAIVGNADDAILAIQKIEKILKVNIILLQIDFGQQPFAVARNSLEIFINEVMPYFSSNSRNSMNEERAIIIN